MDKPFKKSNLKAIQIFETQAEAIHAELRKGGRDKGAPCRPPDERARPTDQMGKNMSR